MHLGKQVTAVRLDGNSACHTGKKRNAIVTREYEGAYSFKQLKQHHIYGINAYSAHRLDRHPYGSRPLLRSSENYCVRRLLEGSVYSSTSLQIMAY